jgi:hypothetical protein
MIKDKELQDQLLVMEWYYFKESMELYHQMNYFPPRGEHENE